MVEVLDNDYGNQKPDDEEQDGCSFYSLFACVTGGIVNFHFFFLCLREPVTLFLSLTIASKLT